MTALLLSVLLAAGPVLGGFYNLLGTLEFRARDFAASRRAFEKSLAITRLKFPDNHPSVMEARAGIEALHGSGH